MKRLLGIALLLASVSAHAQVSTAKPDCATYSVNSGATYAPTHLWLDCEGSGTSVADEGTGTAATLTISGADWAVDGTHGNVLDFVSANSDYAEGSMTPNATAETCYEVVRVANAVSATGTIIHLYDASNTFQYSEGRYSAPGAPVSRSNGGTASEVVSGTQIDDGSTFHLLGHYWNSSDTVGLSLDGGAWTTDTGSGNYYPTGMNTVRFGGRSSSLYSDVRIVAAFCYDSQHNDAMAAAIYNSGDPWTAIGVAIATSSVAPARRRYDGD